MSNRRANATIPTLRDRLLPFPNRCSNQMVSSLVGWNRRQHQASSIITARMRLFPALLMPSSRFMSPLAYGVGGAPACDVVVGPGNRWVTAAKSRLVATEGRAVRDVGETVALASGKYMPMSAEDAGLCAADFEANSQLAQLILLCLDLRALGRLVARLLLLLLR